MGAEACRILKCIRDAMSSGTPIGALRRRVVWKKNRSIRYFFGGAAIVSVVVGDIEKTFAAGKSLFDRGFYVQSPIYPAVPINGGPGVPRGPRPSQRPGLLRERRLTRGVDRLIPTEWPMPRRG